MKTISRSPSPTRRSLFQAGLLSIAFVSLATAWQPVDAQPAGQASAEFQAGARLHAEGVALEHRKDDYGAFVAFTEAAQNGYPPAQRKLGDIYGNGNRAVARDYEESLRWYQKARENGEEIPPITSRMPGLNNAP